MHYCIEVGRIANNHCACVPDLPGCIAAAATPEAVESEIREAICFHVDGLHADGESVPESAEPFDAFTEWGGTIDDEDYADL